MFKSRHSMLNTSIPPFPPLLVRAKYLLLKLWVGMHWWPTLLKMQFLAWDPVFIYMRFFSNINEIFLNEIFLLCLWDFSQFVRFSPYVYEVFLKLWAFSQIVRFISLINEDIEHLEGFKRYSSNIYTIYCSICY